MAVHLSGMMGDAFRPGPHLHFPPPPLAGPRNPRNKTSRESPRRGPRIPAPGLRSQRTVSRLPLEGTRARASAGLQEGAGPAPQMRQGPRPRLHRAWPPSLLSSGTDPGVLGPGPAPPSTRRTSGFRGSSVGRDLGVVGASSGPGPGAARPPGSRSGCSPAAVPGLSRAAWVEGRLAQPRGAAAGQVRAGHRALPEMRAWTAGPGLWLHLARERLMHYPGFVSDVKLDKAPPPSGVLHRWRENANPPLIAYAQRRPIGGLSPQVFRSVFWITRSQKKYEEEELGEGLPPLCRRPLGTDSQIPGEFGTAGWICHLILRKASIIYDRPQEDS
ncbi:splicing factor, proline- and glutamine-rich-like [Rhinopithecus roxellana]|uniref:splicing factor, proline- and glutamine-rich-like n=1 Tax=Rhinopithecus roxellana TaxID=61622 RepID=UPI0012379760|nr:splicing factor, proline- and glutamine-rich-like [Rhinopithecus roxellana]